MHKMVFNLIGSKFQNFPGEACPRTPLDSSHLGRSTCPLTLGGGGGGGEIFPKFLAKGGGGGISTTYIIIK